MRRIIERILRKILEIPECLWEKIFRRKELRASQLSASFLGDKVRLLTTGESVNLDQHERNMILSALEYVPFRRMVEWPETKATVRKIYRGLREKIQLSIKKDRVPDRMDITPNGLAEVEEDDETKEAKIENS